ncbi:HlyD family secretion protein [Thermophagus xiamenensis]|uniref:HlyD family secretion protein n=1 Tax=Thermophagus xiamenensis TaxID=385682 RepID=A0A1I2F6Z3_9BACT|nr:HlyD family efflux transporter periplasmic adaptor subunit [Thermophagus xiamenensis]SFF00290.1 HlyD family secretion protein [Thermophagus xiamenensis]
MKSIFKTNSTLKDESILSKFLFIDAGFLSTLLLVLILIPGCSNDDGKADAYGNFEADEVIISSEIAGKIEWLQVDEGDILEGGKVIAMIDTTIAQLELEQLLASKESVEARLVQLRKSIEVQKERLKVMEKEVNRVAGMFEEEAISAQKYDEITGQYRVTQKELAQVQSQALALKAEMRVVEAKINAARERLARCKVKAPFSGTILQKYAEAGEVVAFGKPLLKMAKTDELILRAYISGVQLDDVTLGQSVRVAFDRDKKNEHQREGKITWISASAEFTPKIIQTKEERVDLVYAIKVKVPNYDGKIKIGMPGEVFF